MLSRKISRVIFLSGLIGLVLLFSNVPNVRGHAAGSMTLAYDSENEQLTIYIAHSVSDNLSHYIDSVIVTKNGAGVIDESYTSQPTTSSFSYIYNISAIIGDELSVSARCSQGGTTSESLIIADGGATDDDDDGGADDDASSGIPGYGGPLLFGISMITIGGLIVRKFRKASFSTA